MTRAAVVAMGCTLFAPDAPSAAATSVLPPAGVSSTLFVKELKSRFGAIITDGQGEMKGQIFRIAHLGFFDYMDTIALIGALEQVMVQSVPQAGVQFGAGLIAAQKLYAGRSATAAAESRCLCGRTDNCCSLQHSDAK
jgi:aspartate aminotransferase-like enzyme